MFFLALKRGRFKWEETNDKTNGRSVIKQGESDDDDDDDDAVPKERGVV